MLTIQKWCHKRVWQLTYIQLKIQIHKLQTCLWPIYTITLIRHPSLSISLSLSRFPVDHLSCIQSHKLRFRHIINRLQRRAYIGTSEVATRWCTTVQVMSIVYTHALPRIWSYHHRVVTEEDNSTHNRVGSTHICIAHSPLRLPSLNTCIDGLCTECGDVDLEEHAWMHTKWYTNTQSPKSCTSASTHVESFTVKRMPY